MLTQTMFISRASLWFEKDSFWRFIEKFSLVSNRSELLIRRSDARQCGKSFEAYLNDSNVQRESKVNSIEGIFEEAKSAKSSNLILTKVVTTEMSA